VEAVVVVVVVAVVAEAVVVLLLLRRLLFRRLLRRLRIPAEFMQRVGVCEFREDSISAGSTTIR
jgi:hypothetical protein